MIVNKLVDVEVLQNEIKNLLVLCQMREVPLKEIQSIFRENEDLGSDRNYPRLSVKINNYSNLDTLKNIRDKISDIFESHKDYDDKKIEIYKVSNDIISIEQNLDLLFDNKDIPIIDEISVNENEFIAYMKKTINSNLISYQFIQKREIEVRKDIDPSKFSDLDGNYTKIYGLKKVELVCFDAIWIDKENKIVIIMIDLHSLTHSYVSDVVKDKFLKFVNKIISKNLLVSRMNLYPRIKALYDSPIDKMYGVIDLNFVTKEGTTHHEKIRSDVKDLRKATYHKSGVNGLKNTINNGTNLNEEIDPYRISFACYKNDVIIKLNSNYREIYSMSTRALYNAQIVNARSLVHLKYVLKQLEVI